MQVPVGRSRAANGTVVSRGFRDCSLDTTCGFHSFDMVAVLNEAKAATAIVRKFICIVTRNLKIMNESRQEAQHADVGILVDGNK